MTDLEKNYKEALLREYELFFGKNVKKDDYKLGNKIIKEIMKYVKNKYKEGTLNEIEIYLTDKNDYIRFNSAFNLYVLPEYKEKCLKILEEFLVKKGADYHMFRDFTYPKIKDETFVHPLLIDSLSK